VKKKLARIIDLKNRKFQLSESPPPSKPARPVVKIAALKPQPIVKSEPLKHSFPLRPEEPKPSEPETKILKWTGPIYVHQPDKKAALLLSFTLFAIAALFQIFQKNLITTILFSLLGMIILIKANKKPEIVNFEINPLGVKVGEKLYQFREIKSFWIEYEPELNIKELSLQPKKWYHAFVKIPIYDQNPIQLRAFLLKFLPEVEHKDSLADALSRKLGL
jgi:hypothetical protein